MKVMLRRGVMKRVGLKRTGFEVVTFIFVDDEFNLLVKCERILDRTLLGVRVMFVVFVEFCER